MILASFAEVLSIGAVIPFLGVLTVPEKIYEHELAEPLITLLKIHSPQELLLPFTLAFIVAAMLAGTARIVLLWVQTRLSTSISTDFSVQVFERTLHQPYSVHVSRSSSEVLAGARKAQDLLNYIINPALQIASSLVILLAVIGAIISLQPFVALTAFAGFGLIYIAMISITKRHITNNSKTIAFHQGKITKNIQEGLGGIRDVLIDGTQHVYTKLFKDSFVPWQEAVVNNLVVSASPRFGMEALGMMLIAGIAYLLTAMNGLSGDINSAIPILGALALGAQRLLPVLQNIYSGYITIRGHQSSSQDALDLLNQKMPENYRQTNATPMAFSKRITLQDLGFRYTPNGPWVIRHFNLEIPKGSRVGIVGVTGSGKSTLLDLVMCLLSPNEGEILIDGTVITPQNTRAWQAHISHVPQQIYLSDASIVDNIAFGVPPEQVDLRRVKLAAQQAQIAQTISTWPSGYDTIVGERGIRLSGGQRQRIGIARALYREAKLIIFDEATSALDNETEASVMQAIDALNRDITLLIIAHRTTTLRKCDRIVEIECGRVKAIGSYEQMIQSAS